MNNLREEEELILIEVSTDIDEESPIYKARVKNIIAKKIIGFSYDSFEKSIGIIPVIAKKLLAQMKANLAQFPKETTMEFGFGFTGDGQMYFLKAGTHATIKVKLIWDKEVFDKS